MALALTLAIGTYALSLDGMLWGQTPQDKETAPPLAGGGPVSAGEQNIVMAMRAPKHLSKNQIEAEFRRPKNHEKYRDTHNWKTIKLTTIRKETYDSLKQLFASGFMPVGPEGKINIIRRIGDAPVFELNLPKKYKELGARLLNVTIHFGGDTKPLTLDPGKKEDEKYLDFHNIGVYTLRLDPKAEPKSYVVTVVDPATGEKTVLEQQPWPQDDDAYWLIELSNFTGSLTKLFDGLRDDEVMPAPFQDIVDARASTLVVGTMTPDVITDDGFLADKSHYVVRITPPLGKPLTRFKSAWMHFPVTGAEKDKLLAFYRNPSKFETDKELVEHLLKEGIKNPIDLEKPSGLEPTMAPQWFEIPKTGSHFERVFKIEDVENWKKRNDTTLYRLVVYQFNSPDPSAIPLREPGAAGAGPSFYVMAREVSQWPTGIRLLADAVKKKELP